MQVERECRKVPQGAGAPTAPLLHLNGLQKQPRGITAIVSRISGTIQEVRDKAVAQCAGEKGNGGGRILQTAGDEKQAT